MKTMDPTKNLVVGNLDNQIRTATRTALEWWREMKITDEVIECLAPFENPDFGFSIKDGGIIEITPWQYDEDESKGPRRTVKFNALSIISKAQTLLNMLRAEKFSREEEGFLLAFMLAWKNLAPWLKPVRALQNCAILMARAHKMNNLFFKLFNKLWKCGTYMDGCYTLLRTPEQGYYTEPYHRGEPLEVCILKDCYGAVLQEVLNAMEVALEQRFKYMDVLSLDRLLKGFINDPKYRFNRIPEELPPSLYEWCKKELNNIFFDPEGLENTLHPTTDNGEAATEGAAATSANDAEEKVKVAGRKIRVKRIYDCSERTLFDNGDIAVVEE